MTKNMFYKKVFELIKRDDSFFNVICEIMRDFELDGTEVGEWIKDDKTLMENITAEFKLKSGMNSLF